MCVYICVYVYVCVCYRYKGEYQTLRHTGTTVTLKLAANILKVCQKLSKQRLALTLQLLQNTTERVRAFDHARTQIKRTSEAT
jgi:hypothetical protein